MLILLVAVPLAWSDPPVPAVAQCLTDGDDSEAGGTPLECQPAIATLDRWVGVRSPSWAGPAEPDARVISPSHTGPTNKRAHPSH